MKILAWLEHNYSTIHRSLNHLGKPVN